MCAETPRGETPRDETTPSPGARPRRAPAVMTCGLLCLGLALTASACGPAPKILVSQEYAGERAVQYIIQRANSEVTRSSGEDEETGEALYHFYLRVCDVSEGGGLENCQEQLVLPDVRPKSLY